MAWFIFALTAVGIVIAANQLAKYGDVIALRTGLGGMFIGVILLAGATSLPEVLTSISSLRQNSPNLAAGNLLGSNTFNMFLLAIVDLANRNQRILRKVAFKHAVTGSLTVLMIGLVVFFMLANIDIKVGPVGIDSLILIAVYIVAVRLIQKENAPASHHSPKIVVPEGTPALWKGILGFTLAAAALVVITPVMVRNANIIADSTGLGTTFIGTTLVALVTSLPELVTTLAAVKIGAADMAIGNLFGSNLFNMFAFGLTDFFYPQGRFLAAIDPAFLLIGITGLLLTSLGLIGNLVKLEKRAWFIEIDALVIFLFYLGSLWLLYLRA